MEMPSIPTSYTDKDLNFTFTVFAYRKLTQEEMQMSYNIWRGQKKSNKPKRNTKVEIVSIIGHDE